MLLTSLRLFAELLSDSLETAINSSSDALFTAVAEFKQWRKNGKGIKF